MASDLGLEMLQASEEIRKLGSKNAKLIAQKLRLEKELKAVNSKLSDFNKDVDAIRKEYSSVRKVLTDKLVNSLLDAKLIKPVSGSATKKSKKSNSRVRITTQDKKDIVSALIKKCKAQTIKFKGDGGLVDRFEIAAEDIGKACPGIQSIKFFSDFLPIKEGVHFKTLGRVEGTEIHIAKWKKLL